MWDLKESVTIRIGLVMLLCVLLTACGPQFPQGEPGTDAQSHAPPTSDQGVDDDGYVHIGPPELSLMLEDRDFLLVNTHTPYGYEIEYTDAHVPIDDEGQWLRQYPDDKATKIVLYCRSGRRSLIAARELVAAGYTNVWHLDGGMAAWHAQGLPLMRD